MSEIKNILVATDFSDISDNAFNKAVDLARQLGARLHIIHIVQIHAMNMPESGNVNVEELEAMEEKNASDNLQQDVRERCCGMDVETHILNGNPAVQINRTAGETGADIIVMGTHGRTGFAHLIMGSVAESVLKKSDVPVMCVRGAA